MLFLVINLMLCGLNNIQRNTRYILSEERVSHIKRVLEDEGVSIQTNIPTDYIPQEAGILTYRNNSVMTRNALVNDFFAEEIVDVKRSTEKSGELGESSIYYFTSKIEKLAFYKQSIVYTNEKVDKTLDKPTVKDGKDMGKAFIKRLNLGELYNELYIEVEEKEEMLEISCYPMINNLPIFNLPIEMQVYKEGIAYAIIYLGEVSMSAESKNTIVPIDLVLFGLKENMQLEHYGVIEQITLGYKNNDHEINNLWGGQIIPTYKIVTKGLEIPIFVNAYTNEIVK